MLTWLYDLLMTLVSFVMSFFGFEMKKKGVTFASDAKEDEEKKEEDKSDDNNNEVVAPKADDVLTAAVTAVAE